MEVKNFRCKYCNAKKSSFIAKCPNPECSSRKWKNPTGRNGRHKLRSKK